MLIKRHQLLQFSSAFTGCSSENSGSGLFALCTLDGKSYCCPGRKACGATKACHSFKAGNQGLSAFGFETRGSWASEMLFESGKRFDLASY